MSNTTSPFALGSFGFAFGAALLLAMPPAVEAAPATCGPDDAAKELQALMSSADMATFRTPDGSMTAKAYFEQFPVAATHMSEKRYTAACRMYEAMGAQLKAD